MPALAPVLVLGFNRPDLLARVLAAVRRGGRRRLLVSLDGPRPDHPGDLALCAEVRHLADEVDWADGVEVNTRESNAGCGMAVSSGIGWALSRSERVIVLEDDTLPDPSFLPFCDELLERFAGDRRVMQIAGCNWGAKPERYGGDSYAFSSFAPVWGWATWRRAWESYEYEMDSWPRFKERGLGELDVSRRFGTMLSRDWDRAHAGHGSWDHQWQFAVMRNRGLSVSPARNLVVNIGFRADGTHLVERNHVFSELPLESLPLPLRHPPSVERNAAVDALFEQVYWSTRGGTLRTLYRRLVPSERLRRYLRGSLLGRLRRRPT